jgi:hypothetical protein
MENILNKSYKRKNDVNSDIFTALSIDNDFVIFSNGAKCKIATLMTDFVVSDNNFENVSESVNLELNPDTFFDTPLNTNDPVYDQLDQAVITPGQQTHSQKLRNSVSLDESVPNKPLQINAINKNGLNLGNDDNNDLNNNTQNSTYNENRLPEWDVFDRVKKSEEIDFELTFKIKLPKAQKIDALNDMFETSFINYLAKQYIKDNVINNTIDLQLTIKDAIEKWVDDSIYGNKKTTTKKTRKPIVKTEVKTEVDDNINTQLDSTNTSDFFNNIQQPIWDGDLKKIILINTQEQYIAVQKQLNILRENNPDSIDIDRYEDLMLIYDEQIKDIKK